MKRLVFFLVILMVIPFGSKHSESIEKNEVERVEYLSQTHVLSINQKKDQRKKPVSKALNKRVFTSAEKSHFYSGLIFHFKEKIYLYHRSLLI